MRIDEIIESSGFDGDFDRYALKWRLSDIDSVATMFNPRWRDLE